MILILTSPDDPTAEAVCAALAAAGAAFLCFDPAAYPTRASLTVGFDGAGGERIALVLDGVAHDLTRVSAVWCRRPGRPEPMAGLDAEVARYVRAECEELIAALYGLLDCPWLPAAPQVLKGAQLKLRQLRLAAELGFTVPPTLITDDGEQLMAFAQAHGHRIISKLTGPTAFHASSLGRRHARYTEPVLPSDLAYASDLRGCPMTFQAYVDKAFEVRVTVVGARVFATAIHSQQTHRTRIDWRRYDGASRTRYQPYPLPDAVARRCQRLLDRYGLRYGAIDLIVTGAGDHVFLELNPAGESGWIEDRTGAPIAAAIAELLAGGPSHPMEICA